MREIKFRAWDKKNKTMWYSDNQGQMQFKGAKLGESSLATFFGHCYNGTIMQYTGLKDKQGKEIYAGDIVSRFAQDVKGRKVEDRYPVCFGVYGNEDEEGGDDWIGGNGWYLGQELFFRAGKREVRNWESKCKHLISADDLEVIGNIYESKSLLGQYENSELLEVK